jgi:hypothetical protein
METENGQTEVIPSLPVPLRCVEVENEKTRELICCTYLWQKIFIPISVKFHSAPASSQIFTAYFLLSPLDSDCCQVLIYRSRNGSTKMSGAFWRSSVRISVRTRLPSRTGFVVFPQSSHQNSEIVLRTDGGPFLTSYFQSSIRWQNNISTPTTPLKKKTSHCNRPCFVRYEHRKATPVTGRGGL